MSASATFHAARPTLDRALDWAERATRSMLGRLAYAQRTGLVRVAIVEDGRSACALEIAGRYLLWPTAPRPARFARVRAPALDDVGWRLAMRGSGGALPEVVPLGRYGDLCAALTALVRETLADGFRPLRHRARATDQASRSPRQDWR